MNRQILKVILVYLPLMLASTACIGQLTEISPLEGRVKGKISSVLIVNYNIVKTDTAQLKEFNDKCTYLYNLKGLLIEEQISDHEGTNPGPFRTVYSYDTNGNRNQSLNYTRNGELRGKAIYKLDPSKRMVEVRVAHTVTNRTLLNKAGIVIETTDYHYDSTPFSTLRFRYDQNGLCIESIQSWAKSADLVKIVYEYDVNHNLNKMTTFNNSKSSSTYTYTYSKYDKMENWLTQYSYRDGILDGVTERTIIYQ
jgi:hypothetical protein